MEMFNSLTTTGMESAAGLRMDDDFYSIDTIGRIDAPSYIVTGSAIGMESWLECNKREAMPGIVPRGHRILFKYQVNVTVWDSYTNETEEETVEFYSERPALHQSRDPEIQKYFATAVSRAVDMAHDLREIAEVLYIGNLYGNIIEVISRLQSNGTITRIQTAGAIVTNVYNNYL